ncbi:Esterase-like activity of phytase domain containing protein [Naviculisporaceae sp. PSN 640]
MASIKQFLTVAIGLTSGVVGASVKHPPTPEPVTSISCNGKSYSYNSLAGFGALKSDARDQYGDTISIGSAIAVKNWRKTGKKYKATLYGLPDRGWNTNGTQNTIPRLHIFDITFTPAPDASVAKPSKPNLDFDYKKTILLSGPDGKPMTGLDADLTGGLIYPGFPTMPAATYPGDGFGGPGPGGKRISLDAEGLVVEEDGSFWISDEYGPFLYKFSKSGKLVASVQPPDAILPIRNKKASFASNNPPIYGQITAPNPTDPDHGRQNNQGFEGLTVSPDGKTLWVMLQSATRQDGGASSSKRRNTRFLKYSLKKPHGPRRHNDDKVDVKYEAEYVVPLPTFVNAAGQTRVAAQSEIHYISDTQFLVLPRDSSVGRGYSETLSRYRHVDVVDISGATNIKGPKFDDIQDGNITAGGITSPSDILVPGITPATLCPFLDFNINTELSKFTAANGHVVHNGGVTDRGLLNEKWESLALLPVNGERNGHDDKDEYYLIAISDNDFITNNGYINFGKIKYADTSSSVPFLDQQALVFKITLPKGSKPLLG